MMITAEPTEIHIPAPLDHQWPIVESAARFKVVRAGRRGGKTVLAEGCAIVGHGPEDAEGLPLFRGIVHDLDVVWVARDYTQAGIMWHEFIRPRFKGVPGVRVNEAERTVTILGAGTLFVISAENIASARGMGKRLAGMIVEEAAWLDLQSALKDVILPALMDNEGWLLLISTTNAGQDGNQLKEAPSYFNRICQDIRAGERSDEWAEFHFTAEDNPKITARAFQSLVAEYAAGSAQLEQEVYAKLIVGGVGLALEQVEADKHIVPRFKVPEHWMQFGAFDWGFNHPYSFGWYAADEDGNVVKLDTLTGRKEQLEELAAKIEQAVPVKSLAYIVGGRDLDNDVRARGEYGPTLKEKLQLRGWVMIDANTSRVSGLQNLRAFVEWKPTKYAAEKRPRFVMMDTPGNRRTLKCLQMMQVDPKKPEDALKVDADQQGRGGDDPYDETRYALMSRAKGEAEKAPEASDDQHPGFDYKARTRKPRRDRSLVPDHPQDDRRFTQPHNWRAPRWDGSSDDMEEQ
jgi:hypothetical protein